MRVLCSSHFKTQWLCKHLSKWSSIWLSKLYECPFQAPYKAFNRIGYAIHHISRRVLNSHSYAVTLSDYKNPIGKLPNPLVFTNFNANEIMNFTCYMR